MISFNLQTQIYRPLRQIFNFVSSPENDFQWQYGTMASVKISKDEMGIGTLFRSVGHFMGRRIEGTYEVTEFEPNKTYGFKSFSGPIYSRILYTFEVLRGSTKIAMALEANPGDLFKTNDVIIGKKVKKQYEENFALLKSVLEAERTQNP